MIQPETQIAREALQQFGIRGQLRVVAKDGLDRSYRVSTPTGEAFALRVSDGTHIRAVSAFRVEADWIYSLYDNPWVDIPRLNRTPTGSMLAKVKDPKGVVRASTLLSWIPGRKTYRPSPATARSLSQAIAALHQSSMSRPTPSPDDIKTWDGSFMCSWFLKGRLHRFSNDVVEICERVHEATLDAYASLDGEDLGLINADVGLHNTVWYRGRPGIVDFNDAGIGPYAFCLGRLLERLRGMESGDRHAEALLAGYEDVMPLPRAYVKWPNVFEAAPAVFRFDFSLGRIEGRGTDLSEREQRIIDRLRSDFRTQ